MLRLRTRRIVAALEPLQTTMSQEVLFQAVEYLLNQCLRHEVRSEEALDRGTIASSWRTISSGRKITLLHRLYLTVLLGLWIVI